MERTMQTELELILERMPLKGIKLVDGREYFTGNNNLKFKYQRLVESRYDAPHGILFDKLVHRFIAGKIEGGEIVVIAQIDILKDNLQINSEGEITANTETKYPTKIYFRYPHPSEPQGDTRTFARLTRFALHNSFLLEESN